tara:strand:- start:2241 stop:2852 length:612 start_codon:yes stop_codon:yes gene_type:complete
MTREERYIELIEELQKKKQEQDEIFKEFERKNIEPKTIPYLITFALFAFFSYSFFFNDLSSGTLNENQYSSLFFISFIVLVLAFFLAGIKTFLLFIINHKKIQKITQKCRIFFMRRNSTYKKIELKKNILLKRTTNELIKNKKNYKLIEEEISLIEKKGINQEYLQKTIIHKIVNKELTYSKKYFYNNLKLKKEDQYVLKEYI